MFLIECILLLMSTSLLHHHVVKAEPNLPFGDINILYLTDVHSFLAGHKHEVDHDADYGDVLSFYQHVKQYCDGQGSDLWFFDNGDFIHGTGLAMAGNATALVPLLKEMPFDAINLGNHEAEYSAVVELMRNDMIPHFGNAFVTSNTMYAPTMKPFGGERYRLLKGNSSTVLVFGFIYNSRRPSKLLDVSRVEDSVQEEWFQLALTKQSYDAIVVLAHMDNDSELVEVILHKIREYVDASIPVQFLTGHTHHRKIRRVEKDFFSNAVQAGGNLDTVAFISLPSKKSAKSVSARDAQQLFRAEFLNTSKAILKEKAGVATLATEDGEALSQRIESTREAMGLNEAVGCPPRDYFLNRSITEEDSLFKLWIDHVAPSQVFKQRPNGAMIISSNNLRYDVRSLNKMDAITVDDIVAIAPYMEPVIYVGEVPIYAVKRLNSSINTDALNHHHKWPDYILSGRFDNFQADDTYQLYTHEFNLPMVMKELDRILPLHNLMPKKTDFKDTLYWLSYAETAWQCPGHRERREVEPWFANIQKLEEEESDGGRSSDDTETDEDDNTVREDNDDEASEGGKDGGSDLHYEGYLPPSTINQFKDHLPPGIAPSKPLKPPEPTAPTPEKNHAKHSGAALKARRKERRKKAKRLIFRVIGAILALALLSIPLYGLYKVLYPDKSKGHAMSDEIFYDMKEMRSLKKRRAAANGLRPVQEIQLT